MKMKFNSGDSLPFKKTLGLHNMIIVVFFHEGNKYYPKVFLEECLYKLQMLEYDRIDVSEGIDANNSSGCH